MPTAPPCPFSSPMKAAFTSCIYWTFMGPLATRGTDPIMDRVTLHTPSSCPLRLSLSLPEGGVPRAPPPARAPPGDTALPQAPMYPQLWDSMAHEATNVPMHVPKSTPKTHRVWGADCSSHRCLQQPVLGGPCGCFPPGTGLWVSGPLPALPFW